MALLFLTHGALYHEPSWRLWFKGAAGALPVEVATAAACGLNATSLARAAAACSPQSGSLANSSTSDFEDEISAQLLFSVYVHLSKDIDGEN